MTNDFIKIRNKKNDLKENKKFIDNSLIRIGIRI